MEVCEPVITSPDRARRRAAKACQRCNRLKVKCDAVNNQSMACSRCRMDGAGSCVLSTSRRGLYDRKARRPSPRQQSGTLPREGCSSDDATAAQLQSAAFPGAAPQQAGTAAQQPSHLSEGHTSGSLASMFEEFLDKNESKGIDAAEQLGIILFGESSPLTFALKESTRGRQANLHDAGSDLSKSKRVWEQAREAHPSHCSSQDIAYLEAKGAFEAPDAELQDQLLSAFLSRFYPLYSIVNKAELLRLHEARRVPWILLHAVCFIGSTFCDASVIHQSSFKSRSHARRWFYDKSKVLFDTGYETDKFVLLQTVIMMSFWGPKMNSYWNPCSWIGFAVTLAESLGIHRSTSSARASGKDKALVKRLWWTLAARDAYCAALLGRPYRIDISQCDTDMLTLEDFRDDTSLDEEPQDHALYQIQVAQLSNIVRKITDRRFAVLDRQTHISELQSLLDRCHAQRPPNMALEEGGAWNGNVLATSLQLLYHYQTILIRLDRVEEARQGPDQPPSTDAASVQIAEAAAQIISSSASVLVTRQLTAQLPHEAFTGFFLAGIVLYRQWRASEDDLVTHMARASLDNCQMLLNEIREAWDPAPWALRIFDFLLSSKNSSERSGEKLAQNQPSTALEASGSNADCPRSTNNAEDLYSMLLDPGTLYSVDWDSAYNDLMGGFGDVFVRDAFAWEESYRPESNAILR